MNTQAIKIIDEMIQEHTRLANENPKFFDHNNGYVIGLKEARDKISSLPSLDIDSLQRYYHDPEYSFMLEDDDGEYVRELTRYLESISITQITLAIIRKTI